MAMAQNYFSENIQQNAAYLEHFSSSTEFAGSNSQTSSTVDESFQLLGSGQEWDSELKIGTENLSVHSLIKMVIGLH